MSDEEFLLDVKTRFKVRKWMEPDDNNTWALEADLLGPGLPGACGWR